MLVIFNQSLGVYKAIVALSGIIIFSILCLDSLYEEDENAAAKRIHTEHVSSAVTPEEILWHPQVPGPPVCPHKIRC